MKTLTELAGTQIRMAAAAIAEAKRSLPREEPPAPSPAPEAAPEVEAPAEAAPEASSPVEPPAEASGEAAGADPAPPAEAVVAAPAKPEKPAKAADPVDEVESDAVKAALDAAVEKATGLSGDRLARLRDAVKVVGSRARDVRLVRVFGPEEPVPGAKTVAGFQYVVDLSPASMKQTFAGPKKERGGRGGGGGGGRGGGSPGGTKAGATGGFSMDSLREDRKGQRPGGGRPGGGGRKPGGGGGPRGK